MGIIRTAPQSANVLPPRPHRNVAGQRQKQYNGLRRSGEAGWQLRRKQLMKEDAYFLQTSRYIHLNPVKAQMTNYPEDYPWSSYQTMIGLSDDRITEKKKTLAYFPKNSIFRYREFVEDIGHKYIVQEQQIRKMIGEDELWLPW